ncbi:alpha/beta hydrolase [uncultured Tateyamaria sp.]|uniref:alpha/beta hydrolase family protein n=1 Tax=uncultured Tateyamaria sp. TaxID=455651 RepID=UPI002619C930|nr:alpha/beta hydrolase [uncultured Tateyamaria sp.]
MARLIRPAVAILVVVLIVTGAWAWRGLSDFDLSGHVVHEVSFEVGDTVLSGSLIAPASDAPYPVAIIVHGDGPQDRFAGDSYLPQINTLLDAGIGVFSWDKAGVGKSTGQWLHQSMDDRADVAIAAHNAVSRMRDVDPRGVGFLGFSQAGWVLPRVANRMTPAFTVLVGAAVSWRDQGHYFARMRMAAEGSSTAQIAAKLAAQTQHNDAVFGTPDVRPVDVGMDADRFRFVTASYFEDSTGLLAGMTGPILAIWGAADLNVDALADAATYRAQLAPLSEQRRVALVPDASHGLLRADLFNYQLTSQWPWHRKLLFAVLGRRAYADNSMDLIRDWIEAMVRP